MVRNNLRRQEQQQAEQGRQQEARAFSEKLSSHQAFPWCYKRCRNPFAETLAIYH